MASAKNVASGLVGGLLFLLLIFAPSLWFWLRGRYSRRHPANVESGEVHTGRQAEGTCQRLSRQRQVILEPRFDNFKPYNIFTQAELELLPLYTLLPPTKAHNAAVGDEQHTVLPPLLSIASNGGNNSSTTTTNAPSLQGSGEYGESLRPVPFGPNEVGSIHRLANEDSDDSDNSSIKKNGRDCDSTSDMVCSICLSSLYCHQVRRLTCDHIFHAACIDVWLTTRSSRCPLCKLDVRDALGLDCHLDCEDIKPPPPAARRQGDQLSTT